MLSIYSAPVEKENTQVAIMNPEKCKETVRIAPMNMKRAQILKKEKYRDGVPANKGEKVSLEWEVKNFTNNAWSDDVLIACSDNSDIKINDQKANLKLYGSERGKLNVDFIMPKDTNGLQQLDLFLYLFDRKENKAIGEELKVKLIAFK